MTFDKPLTDDQRDELLAANVQFQVEVIHLIGVLALDAGVSRERLISALRNGASEGSEASRLPFDQWATFLEGPGRPDLRLIRGGLSEPEN